LDGLTIDPFGGLSLYSYTINDSPDFSEQNTSTFLLRATVVPAPAVIWFFGFGLIGLIGVTKRKKV
jgi:hypothetical protein